MPTNMKEPKTYVPKCFAKMRKTQFGDFIGIDVDAEALVEFARAHKNERGYLKLTIAPRREVDKGGNTHSVYLDTWKPDPARQRSGQRQDGFTESAATFPAPTTQDDVPF